MRRISKRTLVFVAIAVSLALVGLALYLVLSNGQDSSDQPKANQPDNGKIVSTKPVTSSYVRDLDQGSTVQPSDDSAADRIGQFDVSFKQLACRSLLEYLDGDSLESTRQRLSDHALSFQTARQNILDRDDLPATSQPVWEDGLSRDILNQGQDVYGNFRLLANYGHYLEQQPDLGIFDDSDLEFVKRGQIIAYALHYAASPAGQPRPDIAYGLTTEGVPGQSVLNYAADAETISRNLDRYRICDLLYIYTNSSGQGLGSGDFGDICLSGTLPRPTEFSFVMPSLPETAYVNRTVNHPASWPIGYERLTEDCDYSYIDRNQTHQRTVQFLIPVDTDLETLAVDVSDQSILLD